MWRVLLWVSLSCGPPGVCVWWVCVRGALGILILWTTWCVCVGVGVCVKGALSVWTVMRLYAWYLQVCHSVSTWHLCTQCVGILIIIVNCDSNKRFADSICFAVWRGGTCYEPRLHVHNIHVCCYSIIPPSQVCVQCWIGWEHLREGGPLGSG